MKRKILMFLTVIFVLICAMGVLAACGEDKETPVSGDEVGEYYYDAEAGEYLITLSEGCNFTFALGGDRKSGTYKLDNTALTMTFKDEAEEPISAVLADNALTFTYKDVNYRFLKKVTYTVKFVVEGGTPIQDASVVNGKRVPRPEDPTKDRAIFVGWYSDSGFRNEYRFVEPVTGDLTIYARFEDAIPNPIEFTVNFDLRYEGGEAIEPVQTIGGRVFGLTKPTRAGDTFVGWWVSDFEDASKLTYQYTNQILKQDTTLYAVWASEEPFVSVTEKAISWQASGVVNSYEVVIKSADGEEIEKTKTGQNSYSFDFTKQPAGEYTVEVTTNDKTTVAHYLNKALARVSVFKVENYALIFNPIEHAEKYLVSIVCGNPDHANMHLAPVDNGTATTFDFSTCEMRKEGIEFIVTAQADGYVDSVSKKFVFNQTLDKVANLNVDQSNETVTWDVVENATSYILTVAEGDKVDEYVFNENIGNVTSYSLKSYASGKITVTVTPVARGWNSPEAATTTYNKTRLPTPANVHVEGLEIVWDAVDGASEYEVKINDVSVGKTDKTSYPIPEQGSENGFTVSVCAIAQNAANNSLWSDTLTITAGEVGELTYKAGVVSWDPVYGAVKYVVKVNDGAEIVVSETSAAVSLGVPGENTIYVCAVLNETSGERSDWASTVVFAYKITFDPQGGAIVPAQYKANGDPIVYSESAKEGYNFNGWFTAPGGVEGGGVRVPDGFFEGEADITLYAAWESEQYKLELDVGTYGAEPVEGYAYYEQILHLPVPKSNNIMKAFAGWFAEANGVGTQYTNYEGTGYKAWSELKGRKLYAYWVDIYSVTELGNGTLSISKGTGIGYVREITIPVEIDGKLVSTVDDFSSCSSLRVINIPDTIQLIELAASSAAFRSCTNLKEVQIYEVEGNHDRIYESTEDGVLLFNNPRTSQKELAYIPQAKSGDFRIADGVQVIPELIFQQVRNVTSVEIPASVVFIGMQAFYPGSGTTENVSNKIQTITFLAAEEGVEELPLTISSRAFQNCTNLTAITLPGRLSDFTLDAFQGCSKLATIDISGAGDYVSKDGLLCKTIEGGLEIVYAPMGRADTFEVVSGIISIGESAFNGNKNITKLVIPGHVTNIGREAFKGNTSLTEIVFEGDEQAFNLTIGASAFYGCTGLVEVTLPANLYTLNVNAFGGCTKLVEVYVETAGRETLEFANGAFLATNNSASVTTVHLGKDVPTFDVAGVFGAKLARVIVDKDNKNYSSDAEGVLFNGDMTNIVYYPMAKEGPYVIPSTVTKIGERVFQDRASLTSITIPNTVTSIGAAAFSGCKGLTEIIFVPGGTEKLIIEDGVLNSTSTGASASMGAFQGCNNLTKLELPARTEKIGIAAFSGCSMLVEVTIPEGVVTIGDFAFNSNNALTTITIPASVTLLGSGESGNLTLFNYCVNLAEVKVASGSQNYTVIDGVLYGITEGKITDLLFAPRNSKGMNGVVNIPGTVERIWANAFYLNKNISEIKFAPLEGNLSIGDDAFSQCEGLVKVQLPQGLTVIGKMTFNKCKALTEVVIPNTVTSIAVNAFYMCSALTSINFEAGNIETPLVIESSTATSGSDTAGAFYQCTSLETITLPERTTKIGSGAFAGCSSLNTVNIPASVETIDKFAFYKLPVRNVTIAENSKLTEIGDYVFAYSAIEKITLPDGLIKIGGNAFSNCANLTEIVFPNTLETIAGNAFAYNHLKEVRIPASVKTLGTPKVGSWAASGYVFWNSPTLEKVVFEDGSQIEELYGSTFTYCTRLATIDFGKNSSLKILGNDLGKLVSLTSITIPASVTEIGNNVFEGNVSMKSVLFEDGSNLASIGNQAFLRSGLTEFAFPESTADTITLGTALFSGCSNLTKVHLSSKISSIEGIFSGCVSIQVVTVAEGNQNFKVNEEAGIVTNLDGTAIRFVFGVSADTLIIPNDTTEISEGAFFGNAALKSVFIPKSVETIGENAFRNCFNLKTVVFEADSKLTTINAHAFQDCWALESITLPTGLKTLYKVGYTFQGCKSLKSVYFGTQSTDEEGNVTWIDNEVMVDIPDYAFADCVSLETIRLPINVSRIRDHAFSNTGFVSLDLTPYTKLVDFTGNKNTTARGGAGTVSSVFLDCTKLTYVKLPDTAYCLGSSTFAGCTGLRGYTSEELKAYEEAGEEIPKAGVDFGSKALIIGNSCFNGTPLVAVSIPASVTTFGTYVFANCTQLSEINFNGNTNVTALGNYMFQNCTALASITLPTTLTYLGTYTFQNSGLEEIDLSGLSKLTCFGTSATACTNSSKSYLFEGCEKLTEVVLPESLKKIGAYVFDGCTSLNTINLKDVMLIGQYAFRNCAFTSISLPAAALASSTTLGSYAFTSNTKLQTVTFGEGTKYIGVRMFEGCTALKSITIPSTVTTFGTYAFNGCTALESVTFEDGIPQKNLPSSMFKDCTALSEVNFGNNAFAQVGSSMFENCSALEEIALPDTITFIGISAFKNSGLKRIDLSKTKITSFGASATVKPEQLVTSNSGAFYGCENLSEVLLPKALIGFGKEAFFGCTSLKNIDFGSVAIIGDYSFANSGLTNVTIPKTVSTIGKAAFGGCESLDWISVAMGNEAYSSTDGVLYNVTGMLVAYPAGMPVEGGVLTLQDGTGIAAGALYGVNVSELILPDGFTTIGEYAFHGSNIRKITIPDSVYQIGNYAFSYSAFESVTIPANAESIGNCTFEYSEVEEVTILTPNLVYYNYGTNGSGPFNATYLFQYCYNLRKVTFAEGATMIGSNWFLDDAALETVVLPSTLETIGTNAFAGCGITEIAIPASVTEINMGAFAKTASLRKLTFEDGDTPLTIKAGIANPSSISNYGAFEESGLETVVLSNRITEITLGTFRNNVNLTSVTLPEGLLKINERAFFGCTALEEIKLPETLTAIGTYAFAESGLVSITIPDSVETTALIATNLNSYAFDKCYKLTTVKLSKNVQLLATGLFRDCTALTTIELPEAVSKIGSDTFENCTSLNLVIPKTVLSCSDAFVGWGPNQTIYFEASQVEIFAWWTALATKTTWFNGCDANFVFDYTPKA